MLPSLVLNTKVNDEWLEGHKLIKRREYFYNSEKDKVELCILNDVLKAMKSRQHS